MGRMIVCASLTILCLLNSGCGNLSLGPRIATKYVLVYPGYPGKVMNNVTVTILPATGESTVQQDIGGWVVMPQEHFDALKRAVEERREP